ncbi:diguanylate cyclase [Alteromonas sp. CYL-A6]|uniref:diguanylate cyclase n=1 Tax=Alteromonas nitratireducens TaxID=3390813 RepID=UPI0034B00104
MARNVAGYARLCFCLLMSVFLTGAMAQQAVTEQTLAEFEPVLFSDPGQAYQQLTQFSPEDTSNTPVYINWYLIRKAQAENALARYADMADTIAALAARASTFTLPQRALADYLSGVQAHKQGQLNNAEAFLSRAAATASQASSKADYALIIRELGYVYALAGDYYTANLTLHEAYRELVSLNDPFVNGLIEESLADTYNYSGNYSRSVDYYKSALTYFNRLDYPPFIASTLLGLATVNRRLQNWQEALTLFDQYERALAFAGPDSENYYLHYGRAMTLAEMGDCEKALPAIAFALSLDGLADYDAELYKKRALCHIQDGGLENARANLDDARAILDAMDGLQGTQWHLELSYIDGLLLFNSGETARGLQVIEQYYRDYVTLIRRNNSERIARMQTTMEAERKDKEIAFLKQNAQLQDARATEQALRTQQQNLLMIGTVLLAVFLLVFAVIQYRSSQKSLALSIRDELTGLYNRRYCYDYFKNVLGRAGVAQPELSLMTFDIDNFKQINDHYGHQAGDDVIREVAQIASATLRSNDILCRIGGDEFVVVLPRTPLTLSEAIATRFLSTVADHVFMTKGGQALSVTVSLGIAHYAPQPGIRCDIEALMEKADKALYQSKREGKNRYHIAV